MLEPVWPYSDGDISLVHKSEVDCRRREALTAAGTLSFCCVLVTRNDGLDFVDDSRHDDCYGIARDEKCVILWAENAV